MTDDYVLLWRAEDFYVMRELDTPGVCPYRAVYDENLGI